MRPSDLRLQAEIDRLLLEVCTVSQLYERHTRAGREAPNTKKELIRLATEISRLHALLDP